MTGWKAAAATAAIVGATGIGTALGTAPHGQTLKWAQEDESLKWLAEDQVAKVFRASGSQLGVSIRDLGEEDLKGAKASSTGVVIEEVEADSPAQKAGFKAGDVVVEFDGERVRSTRQFTRLVQETPAGRPVQSAVLREGQRVTLTVQPREGGFRYFDRVEDFVKIPRSPKPPPPPALLKRDLLPRFEYLLGSAGRLGITVDELSSQLADYFGTKEGVLVTSVNDNSAAGKAGLKAGDVITALNGGAVTSAADLRRRAQRLEDRDEFTLAVVRDKRPMTIKGKVEQPPARRSTTRTII